MSLSLQIVHELAGTWSVHGLANRPVAHLPSLAASVDYARRECAEAPATIEFMIDGLYAVVHQEKGWPRQLIAQDVDLSRMAAVEFGGNGRHPFRRWRDWVTRRRQGLTAAPEKCPCGCCARQHQAHWDRMSLTDRKGFP
jgi:hypothetical protein